jgi:tetratricopeptide (TPR) repeat protein
LRRLLVPAALLAAAAVSLAGDSTPLDRAMEAFRAGDYIKATAEAQEVAASDPLYLKAQYLIGECCLATGDGEGAETFFLGLLKKKPDWVPALTGLGRALTARGKFDAAMETLRKAVRLDAKDAAARRALGECLAAQEKPVEARKELEQATRLDPKDPLSARSLVEVLVKAGDTGAAGKAAEAYRTADPRSAMADFLCGLVQDRSGSAKDAIASYEGCLAKDPRFLDAHKNLAILCVADNPGYKDRERTEKALAHFAKYFELGGKDKSLRDVYEKIQAFLKSQKK